MGLEAVIVAVAAAVSAAGAIASSQGAAAAEEYQADVARSHFSLAMLYFRTGQSAKAADAFTAARAALERFARG